MKRIYISPLIEVEKVNPGVAVLLGTSVPDDSTPTPPGSHPGLAPNRNPKVF